MCIQRSDLMCGLFIAAEPRYLLFSAKTSAMEQTISITVSGKVQGVFYRQSTKEKALELGISGVVKNLPNGNVHILATGTAEQLNQLVFWCKQGPPRAKVNAVDVEQVDKQVFMGFVVQR